MKARSSVISACCAAAVARCSEFSARRRVFSSRMLCLGVPPLPTRRPFGVEALDVAAAGSDEEDGVLEQGTDGREGWAAAGVEREVGGGTTEAETGGGEVEEVEGEEELMTIDGRAATAVAGETVERVMARTGVACVGEEEGEESDVVRTFFVLRKSSRVRGGEGELVELDCVGVGEVEGECLAAAAAARLLPRLAAVAGVKPSASMGEEEEEEGVEREGEDFPCIQAVYGEAESVGTCMSSSKGEGGSGSSSGMSSRERSMES
jgi:hypothetical protein